MKSLNYHPRKRKRQSRDDRIISTSSAGSIIRMSLSPTLSRIARFCLLGMLFCSTPTTIMALTSAPIRKSTADYAVLQTRSSKKNMATATDTRSTTSTSTATRSSPPPSSMDLPPWLARLQSNNYNEEDLQQHLEWLEYALLEHGFSTSSVQEILTAIMDDNNDVSKRLGMAEFCRLLLQVMNDDDSPSLETTTKDVVLASILHFGDCIAARETGLYDLVQQAIYNNRGDSTSSKQQRPQQQQQLLAAQLERRSDDTTIHVAEEDILLSSSSSTAFPNDHHYDYYSDSVLRIAQGAARLKRAEILAHAVLPLGRIPSPDEPARLRGLLLSVMEDWRALAIRSVACLFRLEGILKQQANHANSKSHHSSSYSPEQTLEIVQTAREALRVYAPLAHQLGLQQLKARLEDRAFRILYRRQYHAVKSLYQEKGDSMKVVSSYLESQISHVLQESEALMEQLEDLQVISRVKEPYSLWKKLLKMRSRNPTKSTGALLHSSTTSSLTSSELSLLDVQDGVALRIMIRARKWSPDETDEVTRARERLLCYYVQHLLRRHWPVVDPSRIKDYIQFPKPNGYESLHYTSSITSEDGEDWPFEVQVRSEEMHRIAEYGVAAHWDYKLGGKSVPLLSPSSHPVTDVGPSSLIVETKQKKRSPMNSSDSYVDALVTARRDLVQQKVFVFFAGSSAISNEGQLLSLPAGARISDAIEELETQLSIELREKVDEEALVRNGKSAKVDEYIANGDVLLINL